MATKRLEGQEALDFLAKNPKAKYTVTSGNVPTNLQPKKDGALVKIAKDITSGPRNTFKLVAEAANQIASLPSNPTGIGYKPLYEDAHKDPFGTAAKAVTGNIALGVPGTGIARGALSGALGNISTDDTDWSNPNSVLKNAITGGITGGALGGLFNKLATRGVPKTVENPGLFKRVGQTIEQRSLGVTPQKAARGVQAADELSNSVGNVLRGRGKNLDARGIGEAYSELSEELGNTLSRSSKKLNTSNILGDLDDFVVREGVDIDSAANNRLLGSLLKKVDDTQGSPQGVANLIRDLDNELSPAFTKLKKGNPLTAAEQLRMGFRESLSRQLKSQVPEVAPIYNDLSLLNQAAPDAIQQFNKAGSIRAPFVSSVQVPTGRLPSRLQQAVGRTLQGNVPGGQTLNNIVGNPLLQRVLTSQGLNLIPQGSGEPQTDGSVLSAEELGVATPQPETMGYQDALRLGLMMSNGNITQGLALANYILNAQQTQNAPRKMTEKQMQFADAADSASRALNLLENGFAQSGKVQSLESKLTNFLGTTSPEQTDYKSHLALSRGTALNALAGANISPSEAQRIADSVPNESDEPGVAVQKLKSFIAQMRNFSGEPNY